MALNKGLPLQAVVSRLGAFASSKLAEKWDNVGLLVEPCNHTVKKIILTNDLTQDVLEESIHYSADMIVSYHPPIFRPLVRLTQSNWKERIIVKALENKIAIYSPHTSFDCVRVGVNDWLISCFGIGQVLPLVQASGWKASKTTPNGCYKLSVNFDSMVKTEEGTNGLDLGDSLKACDGVLTIEQTNHERKTELKIYIEASELFLAEVMRKIQESKITDRKGSRVEVVKLDNIPLVGYGMGRKVKLDEEITIDESINKLKIHLGLSQIRLALGRGCSLQNQVKSVAVCAGSGGSLLKGVNADLYVTGEMSHHEVLDAVENNRTVLLCEHSNTERGYLKSLVGFMKDWFEDNIDVQMSSTDKDPLQII